jgi:hypothetical protein
MAILTQNHIKWISSFTEEQFDNVVYKYLEEVWEITEFVNTDGTNDGGNDLRVFMNGEKLKVNFQVTIQEKGLDRKIKGDLEKAKKNVAEYSYQNRLFFFYSKPVSEEKTNEYELLAETEYGIKLTLIDAKKLAFTAAKYPNLLREINKQFGMEYPEQKTFSDTDRMLYDFYSFGSSTAEIKGQIIKSFIVHKLYTCNHTTLEDTFKAFQEHFNSNDRNLFTRVIEQLIQEKKIIKNQKEIELSKHEERRIDVLKEQFNYQEHEFLKDLKQALAKFNIDTKFAAAIIENLKHLFESNFHADKLDVLDKIANMDSDPISETISQFYKYLRSISNDNKARYLIKELISISNKNDIIQKLSAGKIFTSFADPEVIRNYVNQTERLVFLDTAVILYLLCYYSYDIKYNNYYYNSVKDLLRLTTLNKSFSLKVNNNYLSEITYHIREALLLIDFDKIGIISDLGGTDNVFYNFYKHLKDNQYLEEGVETFEDYIFKCFELSPADINNNYFSEKVTAQIKQCLNSFNISLFEKMSSKDLFNLSIESIQEALEEKDRYRMWDTIYNDASMLVTLFNDSISVNEPVLITWDLILLSARKKYYQKIPASRLWHWFTPDRFNNHFSLLNFNLNSETITRDILSVIDERFNLYKKAQTLLDTISKLINLKTETGRKYVSAIKEFNREYIYEVDVKKTAEYKEEEKNIYPVQELMLFFVKHYHQKKDKSLDDFKVVFQTAELYDDVLAFFKNELNFYMHNKKVDEGALLRMNDLIKKAKEFQLSKLPS